jgi:pyruvate dehydrogenase E1 component
VASTDYMRNYADQIRESVQAAGRRYVVLGTDGFGRSDYRVKLRKFFEVDRHYVAIAALKALADDGAVKPATVADAIAKYQIDTGRAAPWTV